MVSGVFSTVASCLVWGLGLRVLQWLGLWDCWGCLYLYGIYEGRRRVDDYSGFSRSSQTFQNPLIKEYTTKYKRIPNMI